MTRTGMVDRLKFSRMIGRNPRTVDRWARVGVEGILLPVHYDGGRIYLDWDEYREWQRKVKQKRTGATEACTVDPVRYAAAKELLRSMGRNV